MNHKKIQQSVRALMPQHVCKLACEELKNSLQNQTAFWEENGGRIIHDQLNGISFNRLHYCSEQ